MAPWRNGSASDSRSEGCVFKSSISRERSWNILTDLNVLWKKVKLPFFSLHQTDIQSDSVNYSFTLSVARKRDDETCFSSNIHVFIFTTDPDKLDVVQR